MSGDDVKVDAGVAEGRAEVLDVETEVAARGRGPKYAGPVDEVRTVVVVTVPPAEAPTPEPTGPGRPGWTRDLFRTRYREAWEATGPPRTPGRIAANFRRLDDSMGIEPDSLARLVRTHGRPTVE